MNLSVFDMFHGRTKTLDAFPSQSMACLDFISETASEKPLSLSLYRFVIKLDSSGHEEVGTVILGLSAGKGFSPRYPVFTSL